MKKLLKRSLIAMLALAAVLGITALLTHQDLPDNSQRSASHWLPPAADSPLAAEVMARNAEHPGLNGVYPFADGLDAFVGRLSLADHARHTLDERGKLQWQTQVNGQTQTFHTEPQTTGFKRFSIWLMSHLPIEWLL